MLSSFSRKKETSTSTSGGHQLMQLSVDYTYL